MWLEPACGGAPAEDAREPAFDLLERAPERAAVLLGVGVRPSRTGPLFTICHTGHKKGLNSTRVELWSASDIATASTALPTSSKVLCTVYGVISIAALIATVSQVIYYFDDPGGFLLDFLNDLEVTPHGRP